MENKTLKFSAHDGYDFIELYYDATTEMYELWFWEESFYNGEMTRSRVASSTEFYPHLYQKEIATKLLNLNPVFVKQGMRQFFMSCLNKQINAAHASDMVEAFFKPDFLSKKSRCAEWEKLLNIVWVQEVFQFLTPPQHQEYQRTGKLNE